MSASALTADLLAEVRRLAVVHGGADAPDVQGAVVAQLLRVVLAGRGVVGSRGDA